MKKRQVFLISIFILCCYFLSTSVYSAPELPKHASDKILASSKSGAHVFGKKVHHRQMNSNVLKAHDILRMTVFEKTINQILSYLKILNNSINKSISSFPDVFRLGAIFVLFYFFVVRMLEQ